MSGSVSYSVSAQLRISGNYSQVLRQIGRGLADLDRKIAGTERNLVRLAGLFPRFARVASTSATAAATSMASLRAAVSGTSQAVQGATRSINTQAAALNRNAQAAQRITSAANAAAAAMRALSAVPPPQPLPRPPRGGGGAGGGGGGNRATGRREYGLRDPSISEAAGAARGVFGAGMAAVRAGGAEQDEFTMLRAQGFSAEQRARVQAALPNLVRQVPGTTNIDALRAIQEGQNAVGGEDLGQAIALAPMIMRAARLSGAVTKRPTMEAVRPFVRSLAIRGSFTNPDTGQLDLKQAQSDLEELENATIGFGGSVDPREWENFFKRGGIAAKRMSMRGIVGPMGSLMQEVNGDQAGTQLTAFNDQVVSGIISKERRGMWEDLGLATQPGAAARRRAQAEDNALISRLVQEGKLTQEEAATARQRGAVAPIGDRMQVRGRGLASVRGDLWMQEVFAKQMAAKGVTTEDAQVDRWDVLSQRATGRRFGMAMLQTREVQNDIANVDRARRQREMGNDPTGMVLREGYTNSLANLTSSFQNLLTTIGNNPQVVPALNEMAGAVREFTASVGDKTSVVSWFFGDLRQSVQDFRAFAATTGREVEAVKTAFRALGDGFEWLRSTLAEKVGGLKGIVSGITGAIDAIVAAVDGFAARLWGAIKSFIVPGAAAATPGMGGAAAGTRPPMTNPDAEPIPPSWGGPMPGRGGIIPQSFSPMPGGSGDVVVQNVVNLDGKPIAEYTTRHQARQVNAAQSGPSFYDRRRGGLSAGVVMA